MKTKLVAIAAGAAAWLALASPSQASVISLDNFDFSAWEDADVESVAWAFAASSRSSRGARWAAFWNANASGSSRWWRKHPQNNTDVPAAPSTDTPVVLIPSQPSSPSGPTGVNDQPTVSNPGTSPQPNLLVRVPDGGVTSMLLGVAVTCLGFLKRKLS
jgi:hypothetical protein